MPCPTGRILPLTTFSGEIESTRVADCGKQDEIMVPSSTLGVST
jgi:hypothetical protein